MDGYSRRYRIRSRGLRHRRERVERHRHHQSTRDDRAVGQEDRTCGGARHRLAGSADRGVLRRAQGEGAGGSGQAQDRPRDRSLLLRDEGEVAARQRPRPAGPGRTRRDRVRNHRFLARLALDRRCRPRHRLFQRVTHAAVQHQRPDVGRRASPPARRAARDPAGGNAVVACLWLYRSGDVFRDAQDSGRGHRRRPAGGLVRPGLLRSGARQEYLRHRFVRLDEHG